MKNQAILFFGYTAFGHPLGGRAEALAREVTRKGFKVVFIEMPFSPLGFLMSVPPQIGRFKEFLFPKVKRIENIIVVPSLPILPFARLKLVRGINKIIVGLWLKKVLSRLTIHPQDPMDDSSTGSDGRFTTSAIFYNPWWFQVAKCLNITKIYYDCIDEISVICDSRDVELYRKWEEELVRISNAVFTITSLLKEHILNINSKKEVILLPNGVDAQEFKKQADNLPLPDDITQIKRPIVGYVGGISLWVDLELIAYCAKYLKDWSFVLVGPVILPGIEKVLLDIPNVYLLGLKPYKYIPCYIKVFDVCLIPFKLNKMGNSSDPVKLYEYLSIGKPVVSTGISVMKELERLVYVGKNENDFVEKIKEAYEKRNIGIEKRMRYATQNSWDKRADSILSYLNKC